MWIKNLGIRMLKNEQVLSLLSSRIIYGAHYHVQGIMFIEKVQQNIWIGKAISALHIDNTLKIRATVCVF